MFSGLKRITLLSALLIVGLPSAGRCQQTLGELYASDASVKGSVVLAGSGTSVLSGSSIEAGAQTATLKLERGGALKVCAGTSLSITASPNGRSLLFSLNNGSLEMDYPIGAAADSLLTPDLRLLMPGPGTVHVALHVTPQGDTCVQSLSSNTAAIVVSETMSDSTYQLKPDDAILFPTGHIAGALPTHQNCGCPAPAPVKVAKVTPPPPAQTKPLQMPPPPPVVASPEQHLVVQAPFVFSATDPELDLAPMIATLKLEHNKVLQFDPVVLPPTSTKKKPASPPQTTATKNEEPKHGFFSRIGSFFASLVK